MNINLGGLDQASGEIGIDRKTVDVRLNPTRDPDDKAKGDSKRRDLNAAKIIKEGIGTDLPIPSALRGRALKRLRNSQNHRGLNALHEGDILVDDAQPGKKPTEIKAASEEVQLEQTEKSFGSGGDSMSDDNSEQSDQSAAVQEAQSSDPKSKDEAKIKQELIAALAELNDKDIKVVKSLNYVIQPGLKLLRMTFRFMPFVESFEAWRNADSIARLQRASKAYSAYTDLVSEQVKSHINAETIEYALSDSGQKEIDAQTKNVSVRSVALTVIRRKSGDDSAEKIQRLLLSDGKVAERRRTRLKKEIANSYIAKQIGKQEGEYKYVNRLEATQDFNYLDRENLLDDHTRNNSFAGTNASKVLKESWAGFKKERKGILSKMIHGGHTDFADGLLKLVQTIAKALTDSLAAFTKDLKKANS